MTYVSFLGVGGGGGEWGAYNSVVEGGSILDVSKKKIIILYILNVFFY